MASWLVRSTPEQAVLVRALAGDIVLCSWARQVFFLVWVFFSSLGWSYIRALAWGRIVLCSWAGHFTLTVPLSTQVYKWVLANLMLGGNPAMDKHPIQGGVEILLVAPCYGNRDKHRPGGPHWPACRLYLLPFIGWICLWWPRIQLLHAL